MNLTAIMLSDFAFEAKKPSRIARSVTYQTFAEDSVGNQLLILIESWGLPIDEGDRAKITTLISKRAYQSGWSAQIGSTVFEGSTTSAELRELLSVSGNFRYLLNADSAKMMESIFSIKKKQGFTTMAVHSFSGRMFWRVGWWKNLGIDSVFFLEDVVKRKKLKVQSLNYSTPFASLNDEDSYSFITRVSAPQSRKRFVYFLTENSHLPFRQGKIKDTGISQFENKLSEEGNNQLARIQELLFFFMESKLSKEWSKILIVGDHVPPFTNNADRHFYSPTCVPYLILTRN
jgi:phosphoglycerol transferase MdoB-like AlkP superfamily enzyme